ncbi:MAG: hypothetical protein IJ240_10505 [Clostridia bacterium]|nr:hypothetical protein [Clostridia bacterium]
MQIRQLSVFLENNQGILTELAKRLGKEQVSILAIALADTSRFGVVRCVVDDPEKALALMQESGYSACLTDVLAVFTPEDAGGAGQVLECLSESGLDVEYIYMLRTLEGRPALIIGVADTALAERAVQKGGFVILREEDLKKA